MSTPEEMLRIYLAEHDVECPGCAYNLRSLTGTRCPECNQELVLRINLAEPSLGSYIAVVSGPLAAAGAAIIFLGIMSYFCMRYGLPRGPQVWPILGIPLIALVAHALVLSELLRRRGRVWFRSRTPATKGVCIAAGWLLPAVFAVWFVAYIR